MVDWAVSALVRLGERMMREKRNKNMRNMWEKHYASVLECGLQFEWADIRIFKKLTARPMQLKYNNYTHHNTHSTDNKYHLSTEARKSSNTQGPRHDVLPYINLLDKCTQIIREDRIWIRNQLKSSDSQIISIFKEARKPINLQHLQIKLRKYVTTVKSKAKMEQLMKFKENMHLGEHKQPDQKKSTSSHSNRYQLNQSSSLTRPTIPKFPVRQQGNTSFEKTHHLQNVSKNDKKSLIYPYRNNQLQEKDTCQSKEKKFANPCSSTTNARFANQEYPAPMEEITERESQNMTSARHRINEEALFGNTSNNEGFNFGGGYSYSQWKRPDSHVDNLAKDPLEEIRAQFNKVGMRNGNFQEQTKKYLPDQNSSREKLSQRDSHEDRYSLEKSVPDRYSIEKKIPDRYSVEKKGSANSQQHRYSSYEQPDFSSYHEPQPYSGHQNEEYEFANKQANNSLHSYRSNSSAQEDSSFNEHEQSQQTKLMQNAPFIYTIPSSSAKTNSRSYDNDNLFTSPELLAECRNFLKTKSSGKNGPTQPKIDMLDSLKPLNLRFGDKSEHPFSFSQQIAAKNEAVPSSSHFNEKSSALLLDSHEDSTINFYNQIKKNSATNVNSHENYEYFHTFAAQSSQKKPEDVPDYQAPSFKTNLNLKQMEEDSGNEVDEDQNQEAQFNIKDKEDEVEESGAGQIFTAEYFVSFILDLVKDEPRGFVYWTTLEKAVMEQCSELMNSVRDYLHSDEELVLISNIGRVLDDLLESHPVDNDVNNLYKLLDIEQKGFVMGKDIYDFIAQLEDSQAEDVETIGQLLWKLFEEIDEGLEEGEEKKIDYWSLFANQGCEQFSSLSQILKQFDFQIE